MRSFSCKIPELKFLPPLRKFCLFRSLSKSDCKFQHGSSGPPPIFAFLAVFRHRRSFRRPVFVIRASFSRNRPRVFYRIDSPANSKQLIYLCLLCSRSDYVMSRCARYIKLVHIHARRVTRFMKDRRDASNDAKAVACFPGADESAV